MDLLPLGEVRERLRIVGQVYGGVQTMPVNQIIGSLARPSDFDRDFRPRFRFSNERLAGLRAAFPDDLPFPPIEAHEAGGAYFVADGHHRVALARERGSAYIDAEITHLITNYAIPPDLDVCALVHTEQQRVFGEESGLAEARPAVRIQFSRPGGYPELLEGVKAHGYDLARQLGTLPNRKDVAAHWYDTVYLPGVDALRRESLPDRYAYKTDADLSLWVYQRRRALRITDAKSDFAERSTRCGQRSCESTLPAPFQALRKSTAARKGRQRVIAGARAGAQSQDRTGESTEMRPTRARRRLTICGSVPSCGTAAPNSAVPPGTPAATPDGSHRRRPSAGRRGRRLAVRARAGRR